MTAVQTYRKAALSAQSKKNYWDKLTPEQRSAHAKQNWTEERKQKQSLRMKNVRAGRTGMSPEKLEEWNAHFKNAADTEEVRKAKADGAKELWERRNAYQAELQHLRKVAGRYPGDWDQKPIEWRIIGMEILLHPGIKNKELGKLLDASRIITCPYHNDGWEVALSGPGRAVAANYISDIRKWLGMPGMTPRPKSTSIT